MDQPDWGIWLLLPLLATLVRVSVTRSALIAMLVPFTAWGAYIARPSPYALLIALLTAGLCLWI